MTDFDTLGGGRMGEEKGGPWRAGSLTLVGGMVVLWADPGNLGFGVLGGGVVLGGVVDSSLDVSSRVRLLLLLLCDV